MELINGAAPGCNLCAAPLEGSNKNHSFTRCLKKKMAKND